MEHLGRLIGVDIPPLNDLLAGCANGMGPWFYVLLFVVGFCETGLVGTSFLPGNSLLFGVGALAAQAGSGLSMPLLFFVLVTAAVLGDAVNYAIGAWVGPKVFASETSWLFNKNHLVRTKQFLDKYGGKTIILARFVPIVRTNAAFVAGSGTMAYRTFFASNVTGALAWVVICMWSGFFFGQFTLVKKHFELAMVAVVIIAVIPLGVEWFQIWWKHRKGMSSEPSQTTNHSHARA